MTKRSDVFGLVILAAIFGYTFSLGATFNGIYDPSFRWLSLGLLALLVGSWLFLHYRQNWKWHRTSLDTVFLLWGLAFFVSLIGNTDVWRRILIGLWYVGLYIGIWYVLHDLLANRVLSRVVIIDALLIAGLMITLMGFLQLQSWLQQVATSGVFILPPRPVSVFGNPNFLGDFLIVIMPLTLARWFTVREKQPKILFAAFFVLQMLLLLLTNSRGAWIGIAVGLLVMAGMVATRNGRLTPSTIKDWWSRQTLRLKSALIAALMVVILTTVGISLYLVQSLNDPSRSADLRTEIYTAAIQLFAEKPLTGQGLFTFGRGLVRLPGVNADKPHSHAHDLPLHIAAELGVFGIAALVVTVFVGYRTIQNNWQASTAQGRLLLAGATAAVVSVGVHQLTDVPIMMPAIALSGLVALVLALAPQKPEAVIPSWSRFGHPVEMIGIWVVLIVSGVWNSGFYQQYVDVLAQAANMSNYRQAAEQLQSIINADPSLSLTYLEQGLLYGMAASQGDSESARLGVAAYEQFIQLDAGYAVAWTNLAALHWQLGNREVAVDALQQAIKLDTAEWNFQALLGRYAEAMGNTNAADAAYAEALRLYPDASLYTELEPFAAAHPTAFDATTMTVTARVVGFLEAGQVESAQQAWISEPIPNSAPKYVVDSVLAMANGDVGTAADFLGKAEPLAVTPVEQAWVHVGKARLAQAIGSAELADAELMAAETVLIPKPLGADDLTLINIAYAQFLQVALERQYLPQVDYRTDPVLLYLLDRSG